MDPLQSVVTRLPSHHFCNVGPRICTPSDDGLTHQISRSPSPATGWSCIYQFRHGEIQGRLSYRYSHDPPNRSATHERLRDGHGLTVPAVAEVAMSQPMGADSPLRASAEIAGAVWDARRMHVRVGRVAGDLGIAKNRAALTARSAPCDQLAGGHGARLAVGTGVSSRCSCGGCCYHPLIGRSGGFPELVLARMLSRSRATLATDCHAVWGAGPRPAAPEPARVRSYRGVPTDGQRLPVGFPVVTGDLAGESTVSPDGEPAVTGQHRSAQSGPRTRTNED